MAWTEYVISVGPTDQDQAAKVKELMQMKEREQKRREQNVKDSKTYVFSPFTIHFFYRIFIFKWCVLPKVN